MEHIILKYHMNDIFFLKFVTFVTFIYYPSGNGSRAKTFFIEGC